MCSESTNSLDGYTILICVPLDSSDLASSTPIHVGVSVKMSHDLLTVKPFVHLDDRNAYTVMASILERFHGITVIEGETAPSTGHLSPLDMSAWMGGNASLPHAELAQKLRQNRTDMLENIDPFSLTYMFALASGPDDTSTRVGAVMRGVVDSFPLAMSQIYEVCKSARVADSQELQSVMQGITGTEIQEFARAMSWAQDSGHMAGLLRSRASNCCSCLKTSMLMRPLFTWLRCQGKAPRYGVIG